MKRTDAHSGACAASLCLTAEGPLSFEVEKYLKQIQRSEMKAEQLTRSIRCSKLKEACKKRTERAETYVKCFLIRQADGWLTGEILPPTALKMVAA